MQVCPPGDILNRDMEFAADRRKQVFQVHLFDGDFDVELLPFPEGDGGIARERFTQCGYPTLDFSFGVAVEVFDALGRPPFVLAADVEGERSILAAFVGDLLGSVELTLGDDTLVFEDVAPASG